MRKARKKREFVTPIVYEFICRNNAIKIDLKNTIFFEYS